MKDVNRKKWAKIEIVGLILVISSFLALVFSPDSLSNLFNCITAQVFPIVVDVFLTSDVGIAIVVSVIVGRILERFGFTDALIRIFLPIMKAMNINPSVVIPSIYNILGDINASGKVAGPVLVKANATKSEQKIAVATMIQNPQSFATFVLGLITLSVFKINSLPVVLLSIFVPLIVVPFILSKTIYRNTKGVELEELPRFTPDTPIMKVLFDSGIEGMHLLLLVIIPAVAVVFSLIGVLDFIGIWAPIQQYMGSVLAFLGVEPSSGIVTFLVSPTLAMSQVADLVGSVDPRLVVGGFVLANSGLPISVILGQVPVTWAESTDLSEKEALKAAILGCLIRIITATLLAYALTPFIV
ncbi:MAG: hypothetical protein Q4E31_02700 [Intestinibacter bartlettii]|uniref:hypothetical protein n=1 Tax=Intestinibacter bartlettii TaxID=261299 RepID=UPI0026F0025D|nr:hypothetical protein [Intestinibacter bartlettii]MDO5009710.1 hypothetical protein [Intestinibacter bartlettii]